MNITGVLHVHLTSEPQNVDWFYFLKGMCLHMLKIVCLCQSFYTRHLCKWGLKQKVYTKQVLLKKLVLKDGSIRDPAYSLQTNTGNGSDERESTHFSTVHRSCFMDKKYTSLLSIPQTGTRSIYICLLFVVTSVFCNSLCMLLMQWRGDKTLIHFLYCVFSS